MAGESRQSDVDRERHDGRTPRTGGASDQSRAVGVSTRRSRGQTTLDFAVGVSLFLLVVTSVFLFVPGTLQPFTEGSQEDIVAVNRVADTLAEGLLGSPSNPYVLDQECTVEFFGGPAAAGSCRFSGSTLNQRIGVKDRQFVNVTLQGNVTADPDNAPPTELLCWNTGSERLIETDDTANSNECTGGNEVVLASGPTPPRSGSGSSVTARRIVSFNGTDVSLIVKMW